MLSNVVLDTVPSYLSPSHHVYVVAIFGSKNRKTGLCNQIYFIPTHDLPSLTTKDASDSSVCGDCILKPSNLNSCYVRIDVVNRIYRSIQSGRTPHYHQLDTNYQRYVDMMLQTFMNRIGAWGDVACIANRMKLIDKFLSSRRNFTAYTHQWRIGLCNKRLYDEQGNDTPFAFVHPIQRLKDWCMASVESLEDKRLANHHGWRTYRIKTVDEPLDPNGDEIMCPYDNKETSHYQSITCMQCLLCNGTTSKAKNIAINVHGVHYKSKFFNDWKQQVI